MVSRIVVVIIIIVVMCSGFESGNMNKLIVIVWIKVFSLLF